MMAPFMMSLFCRFLRASTVNFRNGISLFPFVLSLHLRVLNAIVSLKLTLFKAFANHEMSRDHCLENSQWIRPTHTVQCIEQDPERL